ncbi:MAG TPA: NirA family protein, partial [Verrucomicrobiota bacterium]|nr:NirA family protein [Verrucomicrobiota bacterium]
MKPLAQLELPPSPPGGTFSPEQKEYLGGFLAGVAQRQLYPYVGSLPGGERFTANSAEGGPNLAEPQEEAIHGTPLSECTKQELWKHELHGLDAWERLVEHAEQNKFPDDADQFRFRFHGLFHVAPAQNSFMLRCRIPAGELTSVQLHGLADLADEIGNGKSAITTRSNLQIREIEPKNLVNALTRLVALGLTSRGAGVDNVRNITASPTAGLDPQELLDVRPYAHALHHYILNHRELYDLPRKFNVAFEGGGSIDAVADTNDIGFMAVRVPDVAQGISVRDGTPIPVEPGIFFRVELCGITGHKQFASDAGLVIKPGESIAVAAAILRVFREHGDRTDRKK